MTARETLKTKLDRLRQQSRETGQVRLSASAVTVWAEAAIHFLLAGMLSGAVLLEECAPFGVALVGAAGSGLYGGAALLGACFGYLSMLGFSQGLRRASAAILTFAVAFAFYDVKLFRRPWVMPVLTGTISAFAGGIVLSRSSWGPRDVAYFVLEVALTVVATWCYRVVLLPMRSAKEGRMLSPERRAGLLFLVSTLLCALASLEVYGGITLGGCLGVLTVLCAAWQGGTAPGAIVGGSCGGRRWTCQ